RQGGAGAVGTAQSALTTARAQCAANLPPDLDAFDRALSQVGENIRAALSGLDGSATGGADATVTQLAGAAQQGLAALDGVTTANDEQTTALSGGFTSS